MTADPPPFTIGIPDDISVDDVLSAIADLDRGVSHSFAPSTDYDLIHQGRRYPPKAVIGLAARRLRGRILDPAEFSGGLDSKCFRILGSLGFQILRKDGQPFQSTGSPEGATSPVGHPPVRTGRRDILGRLRQLLPLTDPPPELSVYWKGNRAQRYTVKLLDGPVVPVDDQLRQQFAAIDVDRVRASLDPRYLRAWELAHTRVQTQLSVGEPLSLSDLARGLCGPFNHPHRGAQQYNVNEQFHVETAELNAKFGLGLDAAGDMLRLLDLEPILDARENGFAATAAGLRRPPDAAQLVVEAEAGSVHGSEGEESPSPAVDEELYPNERNILIMGAPGTGKSYQVKLRLRSARVSDDRIFRITFHPETTLQDFIGGLRPAVKWPSAQEPRTYYEFSPGPLLLALKKAATNPALATAVVIEELNRGNCAAIFGDFFQLLDRSRQADRDHEGPYWSEYSIDVTGEMATWLRKNIQSPPASPGVVVESGDGDPHVKLSLPPNLYLVATANTADQSLFPIDAAFRRRWTVRYVGLNEGEHLQTFEVPLRGGRGATYMAWNDFRRRVNRRIVEHTANEDRQLGPWFVRPNEGSVRLDDEMFLSRLVLYLWSDVFRDVRGEVFARELRSFDEVAKAHGDGRNIFGSWIDSEGTTLEGTGA